MKFDYSLPDAQATKVEPVDADKFNYQQYQEYENRQLEKCRSFLKSDSGVLVYRRMRVGEVFSFGCRDMKNSLHLQLGALKKSIDYKADVPNFLEPWYGIGTIASAFGIDYIWNPNQSPAVHYKYEKIEEAIKNITPVEQTEIGRHTLKMIQYFLEETKGKLPISLCDIQSPLNVAANVVNISNFMMDFYLDPDGLTQFLNILSKLLIDFSKKQLETIGNCIVYPGHGFASSRVFEGYGMSDDNIIMVSNDLYEQYVLKSFADVGNSFGGPVLHSCGNWSGKIESVKKIPGLKMVDAAFGPFTDPDPNPAEIFRDGFVNSGIILNARIVGDPKTVEENVKKLWKPGMRLIVVTYCQTPEEQSHAYDLIHSICK